MFRFDEETPENFSTSLGKRACTRLMCFGLHLGGTVYTFKVKTATFLWTKASGKSSLPAAMAVISAKRQNRTISEVVTTRYMTDILMNSRRRSRYETVHATFRTSAPFCGQQTDCLRR